MATIVGRFPCSTPSDDDVPLRFLCSRFRFLAERIASDKEPTTMDDLSASQDSQVSQGDTDNPGTVQTHPVTSFFVDR
eukprot:747759-Hanusia_phi.AAC.3